MGEQGKAAGIERARIIETAALIAPHIRRTPVIEVRPEDFGLAADGAPLTFKLELLQHAGSFKARGAFANLLLRQVPAAGVAAASGGNHGAAVAFAAMKLGVKARIFVPKVSSPAKIAQIRSYGAELVVEGERYAEALALSEAYVAESGAMPVHAFDQPETMLGQGTLGREFMEQAPEVDTFLVAVGGGGLIGGIGIAVKARKPSVELIGVEPENAPSLAAAFARHGPVQVAMSPTLADGLAVAQTGAINYPIARRVVDRLVTVDEASIARILSTLTLSTVQVSRTSS